jgi:tungstate transport system substrate-binding protein
MTISWVSRGALICALAAACTSEPPLRFGTTSTLQHAGALASLDSLRDSAPGRFAILVGPSGGMLRAAARGDLELVLTHAPALERQWLEGRAVLRCPFVTSRFAIVGPASDPAGAGRARGAADALRRIAASGAMFVSRGDSSGTHERERALWRTAGLDPEPGDTYFETGGDQATTLRLANEWGAYALADLPTLAAQQPPALAILFRDDSALANPYTLFVTPHDSTRREDAAAFAAWLLDVWRPRVAALRLTDGTPAFVASRGECQRR